MNCWQRDALAQPRPEIDLIGNRARRFAAECADDVVPATRCKGGVAGATDMASRTPAAPARVGCSGRVMPSASIASARAEHLALHPPSP